ncbi:MAG: DUF58 domain-containing protein [Alphaproteobacteria bacterium]|nr:DUF58 domain-containing protein [Alphaproteobacteria bacterium]
MTFVPTRLQVALWAVPILLAIGSIATPLLLAPMVAWDLLLVGALVLDALASGAKLEPKREVGAVQSVGRAFDVRLAVLNRGRATRVVRVMDSPPGDAEGLPLACVVPPGSEADLEYTATVDRRGQHAFGPITLRWRSPFGLWERQRRFAVDDGVRVYPDFAQLRSWGVDARLQEERVPVRSRRRQGGENEFQRLRPYVAGDPYRHIDWKATARKREFVTREFGQESNQNVIFLLDAGRMMSAELSAREDGEGGLTAFDHALNAALMMGQVALRHGDRVGLLAFDDRVRAWLPPRGGARSGSRLIRTTYDVFPSLAEPDYALAFRHLSTNVRRRSLVVLFTSVVDEVNAELARNLVRGLGKRHLALTVWVRDPAVDACLERPTTDPLHPWMRGAAAEIAAWRDHELASLRRRGALVVDAPVDQLTPALLARYLEIKARRLL